MISPWIYVLLNENNFCLNNGEKYLETQTQTKKKKRSMAIAIINHQSVAIARNWKGQGKVLFLITFRKKMAFRDLDFRLLIFRTVRE